MNVAPPLNDTERDRGGRRGHAGRPRSPALLAATLLAAVALPACDPAVPEAGQSPGSDPAADTARSAERSGGGAAGEAPVCTEGEGFHGTGELLDETAAGDAANVGDLRWERHEEACERFVIDLLDDAGEPAERVGPVRAELLRDLGVVRVRLSDVRPEIVEEEDARFDGPLATAAYAVRRDDRVVHVDLHLGRAATARAFALRSQARVVVDLRPGGDPLPPPPARSDRAVVLRPRPGRTASYPLRITGYARTFEANVLARIRQEGSVRVEDFTTAADWAGTWGAFEIVLEDGPTGRIELFVGEESARDGTEEGVRLDLTTR